MKQCYIAIMDFKMFFAKRLKEARNDKGYTQVQLSDLSGIQGKAIAKYETGVILPSLENLKKLASALGVSADYFLFQHSQMSGIPTVNDPYLYEKYFILETLNNEERSAILTVLDSVIARQKLRELTGVLG